MSAGLRRTRPESLAPGSSFRKLRVDARPAALAFPRALHGRGADRRATSCRCAPPEIGHPHHPNAPTMRPLPLPRRAKGASDSRCDHCPKRVTGGVHRPSAAQSRHGGVPVHVAQGPCASEEPLHAAQGPSARREQSRCADYGERGWVWPMWRCGDATCARRGGGGEGWDAWVRWGVSVGAWAGCGLCRPAARGRPCRPRRACRRPSRCRSAAWTPPSRRAERRRGEARCQDW